MGAAMNIKKLLGKRLQEIRKIRKLTQEQIAEYVDIDTSSVSNIENGKYYPSAENLEKFLKILNIKPSDIFTFESHAPVDDLINEMLTSMKESEKLTRLMYKFYTTIKY